MGYYIDKDSKGTPLPPIGKGARLVAAGDAIPIPPPTKFEDGLVCVVGNSMFEAAGYAYSPEEMQTFLRPDGRPHQWFYCPDAKKLSGY